MAPDTRSAQWARRIQTGIGLALFVFSAYRLLDSSLPTLALIGCALLLTTAFSHFVLWMPGSRFLLSISEPLIFVVMLYGGPWPAAFLAGLDAFLNSGRFTRSREVRLANGSVMTISAFIAGMTLEHLAPLGFRNGALELERLLLPMLGAALTCYLANTAIVAAVNALRSGIPVLRVWREKLAWVLVSYCFSAGAALLTYALGQSWGLLALLVGVPTMVIVHVFFWTIVERGSARQRHLRELRELHAQMMSAFALAIDSRDPQSRGHARRVQAYAEEIARLVRQDGESFQPGHPLDDLWQESLSAAALLHDIGKLGIPDQLLHKKEGLLPSEAEKVRRHTVLGAAILGRIRFPHPLTPGIKHHHERWDGTGYPSNLRGTEIPLEARIIALADQLDHVYLARGRGNPAPVSVLVSYVARRSGTCFDPRLAELYCDHAEEIELRVAEREASHEEESCLVEGSDDARALADIGQAQREAGVLYDLARQLGTSLDLQDTCVLIARRLTELLPVTSCAIYMADEAGSVVVPRFASGPLATVLGQRAFAHGEGMTGWVYASGEPVVGVDPRIDLGRAAEDEGVPTRSQAVVPITDSSGTLGVISFFAEAAGVFNEDHLRVFDTVMPQVAHALRNAILYEATRTTSMTDVLTGLPNSRFLHQQLEKEVARATRSASPLVVVVLDLDGFKPINDNYGHQAGDGVLRRVAQLLREYFRQSDIVCRYAGDEFVALLPETSPEEARAVVERVQQRLDKTPIEVAPETVVRIGCSAGISSFPLDGASLEELVHRADKEMYRDKTRRHAELELQRR